jgi:hypothetical protein
MQLYYYTSVSIGVLYMPKAKSTEVRFSQQIHDARVQLLQALKNQLEDLLADQLIPQAKGVPFIDFDKDPPQVISIKKFINCLYHAEEARIHWENINVDSLWGAAKAAPIGIKALIQVYKSVSTLEEATPEIRWVIADNYSVLAPIFTKAAEIIKESGWSADFMAMEVTEKASVVINQGIELLGSDVQKWNDTNPLISTFAKITKVMETISRYQADNLTEQEKLESVDLIRSILTDLEHNPFLNKFSISDFEDSKAIKDLMAWFKNIEADGFNFTKKSMQQYSDWANKYFSTLILLADQLEQQNYLKSGILSNKMCSAADSLARQMNALLADPILNITERVAGSDTIVAKRIQRLEATQVVSVQAIIASEKQQIATSAFFHILRTYEGRSLSEITESDRVLLRQIYPKIQLALAHANIYIENNITALLNKPGPEKLIPKPNTWWGLAADGLSYVASFVVNPEIVRILEREKEVSRFISNQIAAEQFNLTLAEKAREKLSPDKAKAGKTTLKVRVAERVKNIRAGVIEQPPVREDHPSVFVPLKPEDLVSLNGTLVAIQQMKLSATINNTRSSLAILVSRHLDKQYQPYFSKLPYVIKNNDPELVVQIKRIENNLLKLQKTVKQFENLDLGYGVIFYLLSFLDVVHAAYALKDSIELLSPETQRTLAPVLQQIMAYSMSFSNMSYRTNDLTAFEQLKKGELVEADLIAFKPVSHIEADKAAKEADKPVKEADKPVKEADKPVKEADKPVKEADKPVKEADKPVKEADKPVKEADKPVKEADKPVKVADKPVKEADKPANEGYKPVKEADKPANEGYKPVKEADKPVKDADILLQKKAKSSVSEYITRLNSSRSRLLDKFKSTLSKPIADSLNPQENGVPFINIDNDPPQLAAIKKMINSLYFAESALKNWNGMDTRTPLSKFAAAHQGVAALSQVYKSLELLTQVTPEIQALLRDNYDLIEPVINGAKDLISQSGWISQLSAFDITAKLGSFLGQGINIVQPRSSSATQTASLVQLLSGLPVIFNNITNAINPDEDLSADKLAISKKRVDAISEIFELFFEDNASFLNVFSGYSAIAGLMELNKKIQSEGINLQESTIELYQQWVEKSYPQLLLMLDEVETRYYLKPGYLSAAIALEIDKINDKLNEVIEYKPNTKLKKIKLSFDLGTVRKQQLQGFKSEYHTEIFQLEDQEKAAQTFFTILKKYSGKALSDMTAQDLVQLRHCFATIQLAMANSNLDVSNELVVAFKELESADPEKRKQINCSITQLLKLESSVNNYLKERQKSYRFKLDIVESALEYVQLKSFSSEADAPAEITTQDLHSKYLAAQKQKDSVSPDELRITPTSSLNNVRGNVAFIQELKLSTIFAALNTQCTEITNDYFSKYVLVFLNKPKDQPLHEIYSSDPLMVRQIKEFNNGLVQMETGFRQFEQMKKSTNLVSQAKAILEIVNNSRLLINTVEQLTPELVQHYGPLVKNILVLCQKVQSIDYNKQDWTDLTFIIQATKAELLTRNKPRDPRIEKAFFDAGVRETVVRSDTEEGAPKKAIKLGAKYIHLVSPSLESARKHLNSRYSNVFGEQPSVVRMLTRNQLSNEAFMIAEISRLKLALDSSFGFNITTGKAILKLIGQIQRAGTQAAEIAGMVNE